MKFLAKPLRLLARPFAFHWRESNYHESLFHLLTEDGDSLITEADENIHTEEWF